MNYLLCWLELELELLTPFTEKQQTTGFTLSTYIRGRFVKVLFLPQDDATIVIQNRYKINRKLLTLGHSQRWLLSNHQQEKLDIEHYRSVIRYWFSIERSRSEIKERLAIIYVDASSSIATVKNWVNARRFLISHFQVPRLSRKLM